MNDSEAFITQLCGTKFQLLQACLRGKVAILKMTLPQKNGPRIKTPYPSLDELGVKLLGKEYSIQYSNTATVYQSITSLKLRIKIVAFFLGHPVYSEGSQGLRP